MFGIILSAILTVLRWLIVGSVVKFVVFFGIYYVTTEFITHMITHLLPDLSISTIQAALNAIPPEMVYFLSLFKVQAGISMMFAALVVRFIIRRMPVIG